MSRSCYSDRPVLSFVFAARPEEYVYIRRFGRRVTVDCRQSFVYAVYEDNNGTLRWVFLDPAPANAVPDVNFVDTGYMHNAEVTSEEAEMLTGVSSLVALDRLREMLYDRGVRVALPEADSCAMHPSHVIRTCLTEDT